MEKFFRNEPIRNKNCLWWPCLLTDRDEMSNLYRGPSIDASYKVSVHLAKRFRRRRFFLIGLSETDDRWRTPSDDKNSHCLWQGELKIQDKNILCLEKQHFISCRTLDIFWSEWIFRWSKMISLNSLSFKTVSTSWLFINILHSPLLYLLFFIQYWLCFLKLLYFQYQKVFCMTMELTLKPSIIKILILHQLGAQ